MFYTSDAELRSGDRVTGRSDDEMTGRILLIAALLWGTTGSAVCEVLCAQRVEAPVTVHARAPEAPVPDPAGCHGHGNPPPDPISGESGEASHVCSCGDINDTAAVWARSAAEDLSRTPAPAPAEISHARAKPLLLPIGPWPGLLRSPFRHQNAPLLS
jgi:hypothetical protein